MVEHAGMLELQCANYDLRHQDRDRVWEEWKYNEQRNRSVSDMMLMVLILLLT